MAGHAAAPHDRRAALDERRARRAAVTDAGIVMEAAAQLLSVRSRSVGETRRRLQALGYPVPLVDEVIGRLEAMGYLDDRVFAATWVASRDRARPRSGSALRLELRRKGIDDAVIRDVLGTREADAAGRAAPDAPNAGDPAADPDGQASADLAAARRLLERKAGALAREPDPRKRRQKAWALLARNGFDPDACREAVASLPAAARDDRPED
jgi:regulatory protein